MTTHDNINSLRISRALVDVEAQLALATKNYKLTGETHFGSLLTICAHTSTLKTIYMATPKHERPEPTWVKYVEILHAKGFLSFRTARMADLRIKLAEDIKRVDVDLVKAMAPEGSYGAARSAVDKLLGIPPKPLKQLSYGDYLAEAMKNMEAAQKRYPDESAGIDAIIVSIRKVIANVAPVQVQEPTKQTDDVVIPPAPSPGSEEASVPVVTEPPSLSSDVMIKTTSVVPVQEPTKQTGDVVIVPPAPLPSLEEASSTLAAMELSSGGSESKFKPTTVQQIAERLGNQYRLARAVGKKSSNASYWIEFNRLPRKMIPKLIAALESIEPTVDLSLIPRIK